MREKILTFIEKNSRIDLKELAIILGVDEAAVVNELQKMEEEHIICGYHTLIDCCLLYTSPSPRDGATSRMPSSA